MLLLANSLSIYRPALAANLYPNSIVHSVLFLSSNLAQAMLHLLYLAPQRQSLISASPCLLDLRLWKTVHVVTSGVERLIATKAAFCI